MLDIIMKCTEIEKIKKGSILKKDDSFISILLCENKYIINVNKNKNYSFDILISRNKNTILPYKNIKDFTENHFREIGLAMNITSESLVIDFIDKYIK